MTANGVAQAFIHLVPTATWSRLQHELPARIS
jgi:hypothetical protein